MVVALALLLGACSAVPGGFATQLDAEQQEVLRLVNEARASGAVCGSDTMAPAPALEAEPTLVRAAQRHSEDMAAARVMSHTTPDGAVHYQPGTRFNERITLEGYTYRTAGENIAAGYPSADAVVAGWLGSPGHCRNIMNPNYTEIGLGEQDRYWTQKFAAPR